MSLWLATINPARPFATIYMALGDFTAELEKPLGLIVLLSCAKDEGLGRTNL
jgi:hypothetical protein